MQDTSKDFPVVVPIKISKAVINTVTGEVEKTIEAIVPRLDFNALRDLAVEIEREGYTLGSMSYVINALRLISGSPEKGLLVIWSSILYARPGMTPDTFFKIAAEERWGIKDVAEMVSGAVNNSLIFQELAVKGKATLDEKKRRMVDQSPLPKSTESRGDGGGFLETNAA